MKSRAALFGTLVFGGVLATPALAAVTVDEAKQLGTALTPWGAERAGNKDGSIPEWTGQVKVPTSYNPKAPGVRPDPFVDDKPLFSITAQNADKYADKLSEGVRDMLKRYPTFRVDVYPSHRTAVYPKYVIDNTLKNATSCKAIDKELQLQGCYAGLPFPIPKTGAEVMWNHTDRFSAFSYQGVFTNWYVDAAGGAHLEGKQESWQENPFYDPKRSTPAGADMLYWRYRADTAEPARRAGEKIVILDAIDQINYGRRVWQYIPGQRRVKLAPDLAYDTPAPQGGGAQNMDDAEIFLGALDRFDWRLIGKKEMYIPYNNFKMADGKLCPDKEKFTKNHMKPDCVRWELHRVWTVEATLKPNFRHIYRKRKFYFDEDAPGAGIGDNYDASGQVYRVSLGSFYPMYESQGLMADQATTHDLRTGTYATSGDVAESGGWYVANPKPLLFFTGEAIAAEGVR